MRFDAILRQYGVEIFPRQASDETLKMALCAPASKRRSASEVISCPVVSQTFSVTALVAGSEKRITVDKLNGFE